MNKKTNQKINWNWVDGYEDEDVVFCPKPKCEEEISLDKFDFTDGETYQTKCKNCGLDILIQITRPISIDVFTPLEEPI